MASDLDGRPGTVGDEPRQPEADQYVDDLRAARVGDRHRSVAAPRDGHRLDGVRYLGANGHHIHAEKGLRDAAEGAEARDRRRYQQREEREPQK